jgi:hypothetical protein
MNLGLNCIFEWLKFPSPGAAGHNANIPHGLHDTTLDPIRIVTRNQTCNITIGAKRSLTRTASGE